LSEVSTGLSPEIGGFCPDIVGTTPPLCPIFEKKTKDGGRFDLSIALGILAASGEVSVEALGKVELLGELALTGELRAIDGVLPAALAAAKAGRAIIVPTGNGAEVALAGEVEAYTARTLLEVVAHINGVKSLPLALPSSTENVRITYPDLADVRGQLHARRALEIAAAGNHHLILLGSI
jgi:magnesium chelatase family protein